jgi:hypothetical protein
VQKHFCLSAYNEIFINKDSPIFYPNRIYAGLGDVVSENFGAGTGFPAQSLEKTNRNQFEIIVLNNIPFTNN